MGMWGEGTPCIHMVGILYSIHASITNLQLILLQLKINSPTKVDPDAK